MISELSDLPSGVIGFEASGKIAAEDYLTHRFGWMTPGEAKTFPLDQKDQAIEWVRDAS